MEGCEQSWPNQKLRNEGQFSKQLLILAGTSGGRGALNLGRHNSEPLDPDSYFIRPNTCYNLLEQRS